MRHLWRNSSQWARTSPIRIALQQKDYESVGVKANLPNFHIRDQAVSDLAECKAVRTIRFFDSIPPLCM